MKGPDSTAYDAPMTAIDVEESECMPILQSIKSSLDSNGHVFVKIDFGEKRHMLRQARLDLVRQMADHEESLLGEFRTEPCPAKTRNESPRNVYGIGKVDSMPASCLDIQTLPVVLSIFKTVNNFESTDTMINILDVPQLVPPGQSQTYRGLDMGQECVSGLLTLTDQVFTKFRRVVPSGTLVLYKLSAIQKETFFCRNKTSESNPWIGLRTTYVKKEEDVLCDNRHSLFVHGSLGLHFDRSGFNRESVVRRSMDQYIAENPSTCHLFVGNKDITTSKVDTPASGQFVFDQTKRNKLKMIHATKGIAKRRKIAHTIVTSEEGERDEKRKITVIDQALPCTSTEESMGHIESSEPPQARKTAPLQKRTKKGKGTVRQTPSSPGEESRHDGVSRKRPKSSEPLQARNTPPLAMQTKVYGKKGNGKITPGRLTIEDFYKRTMNIMPTSPIRTRPKPEDKCQDGGEMVERSDMAATNDRSASGEKLPGRSCMRQSARLNGCVKRVRLDCDGRKTSAKCAPLRRQNHDSGDMLSGILNGMEPPWKYTIPKSHAVTSAAHALNSPQRWNLAEPSCDPLGLDMSCDADGDVSSSTLPSVMATPQHPIRSPSMTSRSESHAALGFEWTTTLPPSQDNELSVAMRDESPQPNFEKRADTLTKELKFALEFDYGEDSCSEEKRRAEWKEHPVLDKTKPQYVRGKDKMAIFTTTRRHNKVLRYVGMRILRRGNGPTAHAEGDTKMKFEAEVHDTPFAEENNIDRSSMVKVSSTKPSMSCYVRARTEAKRLYEVRGVETVGDVVRFFAFFQLVTGYIPRKRRRQRPVFRLDTDWSQQSLTHDSLVEEGRVYVVVRESWETASDEFTWVDATTEIEEATLAALNAPPHPPKRLRLSLPERVAHICTSLPISTVERRTATVKTAVEDFCRMVEAFEVIGNISIAPKPLGWKWADDLDMVKDNMENVVKMIAKHVEMDMPDLDEELQQLLDDTIELLNGLAGTRWQRLQSSSLTLTDIILEIGLENPNELASLFPWK